MRILVFSDTHNNIDNCIATIENIKELDMILHAGDHVSDAKDLMFLYPDIDIRYVKGNCDFSNAPSELIIEAENKKIFLTHGHLYNVKSESDYFTLISKGKELNCDIIVFGHTHIPFCKKTDNITILNPGSAKNTQNFGVIEIENGKIGADFCEF